MTRKSRTVKYFTKTYLQACHAPCVKANPVPRYGSLVLPLARNQSFVFDPLNKRPVLTRFAICLLVLCTAAIAVLAQDRLSGDWRGYWTKAGDTLAVTIHAKRDSSTGRYTAVFDADRLRVSGIPFDTVRVEGCYNVGMTLSGDRTKMVFTGTLRADSLFGGFREGDTEGRFAFSCTKAAGPAFKEREIAFTNGPVNLVGSLILPLTGDKLPAVVFLHGSGAEGRWASRFLATQLARHGIAALIFDKRGVGGSSGDWRQATLDDLAGDGSAAVARLLEESRIDHGQIGIHGHSQGGTLAPLVVARSGHVAFVIGSAAAGVPTDSTEIFSILNSIYPRAITLEDSVMARSYVSELVAVAYHGRSRQRLDSLVTALRNRPWFFDPPAADNSYWSFSRQLGQYDPLEWWAHVHVPVLLIYGSEDQRVPAAESAARISATVLRNTRNADVTVRILPGADHTFRLPPGPSGWPVTAPDYIQSLMSWIALRR
jgi:pimeloyl-ACP methyl ester carboxylesterase